MTLVQFDDVKYIEEFCTRMRHLLHSYGTGLTVTADIDRYVTMLQQFNVSRKPSLLAVDSLSKH